MPEELHFSVVLPLYNKEQSIIKTIESVLRQSFTSFELIIINDGSTDDSRKHVTNIDDSRIRLIDQRNLGVSAARNRGIEESRYELIAFIDADDLWNSRYLQTISELVSAYPDEEFFGTAWCSWSRNMPLPKVAAKSDSSNIRKIFYPQYSVADVIVHICSLVSRKKALIEEGAFPLGVKIYEDQDLICRLAERGPIVFSNISHVYYVRDAENRACQKRKLQNMPPYFCEKEPMMAMQHASGTNEWYLKEFLVSRYLQEISLAAQTPGEKTRAIKWIWSCRKTQTQRKRMLKACLYIVTPAWLLRLIVARVKAIRVKNMSNGQTQATNNRY